MILIELLWDVIKWMFYYTTRPIIWVITARDCRHCYYGRLIRGRYHNPFNWGCNRNYCPDIRVCRETPWRCKFKRRNGA